MDWQHKAAALDALAEFEIKFRKMGDWYVSQNVEIKDSAILRSACGNGSTPDEAIEDHWRQLVDDIAATPLYLVTRASSDTKRRAVRWNGFMWMDVHEPERKAA